MTAILILILLALVFVYINGFHDTANSIATVVSTRALTPPQAIVLATVTNLAGAMVGTAVVVTMSHYLVDARFMTPQAIIAALIGAIVWDLVTWWRGMPTSSSHALVGGLCGAAVAASQNQWSAITWSQPSGGPWWEAHGVLFQVILPMFVSPLLGFLVAFLACGLLYFALRRWTVERVSRVFGRLQIVSAGYMGFAHGNNDAQKTIGVVVLALLGATQSGALDQLPDWLGFLRLREPPAGQSYQVPAWLTIVCAVTLAAGTAAGGWRIIRTLGHRIVKLTPIHGFAAETSAAAVLTVAAGLGFPVSTTHAITASIAGAGATKRINALHAGVVEKILWAWLLTLPATALIAYVVMQGLRVAGGN